MVEYTMNEILCYNSLLDGKKIQGIRLMFPPITRKQTIIDDTLKQLKEEKLVDETGKLTAAGEAKLHIIRTYKQADTFLSLNNIAISFQNNRKMIMAVQNKEGKFMLETGDRAGIMLGLMKEYPFLQCQDKNEQKEMEPTILSEERWEELREQIEIRNMILLQKYRKENAEENIILFSHEGNCYEYQNEKNTLIRKEPSGVRKRIMALLELEGE